MSFLPAVAQVNLHDKGRRKAREDCQGERRGCNTKLTEISTRVLGQDHGITKISESFLQSCKVREVEIECEDGWESFQALWYEEDGRECVLQGPIATPRNIKLEEIFITATENVFPILGTPVVCCGFNDFIHLDGKIGDLRCIDPKFTLTTQI
mmetsp:Transcript_4224/g.9525  ORF Transcript_4224/g.9525 Transcript_4224/m.9525 type:complete len:153 (+) Transcript_4224:1146-1604(+)